MNEKKKHIPTVVLPTQAVTKRKKEKARKLILSIEFQVDASVAARVFGKCITFQGPLLTGKEGGIAALGREILGNLLKHDTEAVDGTKNDAIG